MKKLREDYFNGSALSTTKIEDRLKKYETVIWRGCPKRKSYAMGKALSLFPIALIWGIIDFGIIFTLISFGFFSETPEFLLFIIPFFAIHLTPVWMWVGSLVKSSREVKNTFYFITTNRFIISKGVEGNIVAEIKTDEIKDVVLHRDIIDKILKVGDISISSGKKTLTFDDIPNSEFMYNKIRSIARDNEVNGGIFSDYTTCDHCGSTYDSSLSKCPYCGAPKPDNI